MMGLGEKMSEVLDGAVASEAPVDGVDAVVEEHVSEVVSDDSNDIDGSGEGASEAEVDAAAEEIEQAIEDGASAEEVQEMIETFKIKAYGKEKEVTLDWNDKDSIRKKLELAEAAQPAMQRAAEKEKQLDAMIKALTDDPWGMVERAGHNPEKLAESKIEEVIKQMQKTPEQKAQDEKDKELEELRAKVKAEQEEKESLKFQQLQAQAEIDLENEIQEAISATTQLTKSPYSMKRVADAMAWFMDQTDEDGSPKYPNVKASQVAPIVEKEMTSEINSHLEGMDDKQLMGVLSKTVQERLRKGRLSKIPPSVKTKDVGQPNIETEKPVKMSMKDFLRKPLVK
jgi:hypothetical protein